MNKPTIVCLCGSGRFSEAFENANYIETLAGNIVLTIGVSKHHHEHEITRSVQNSAEFREFEATHSHPECVDWLNERYSQINRDLDELHKRKIDLADEILVLNVGGYIGDSTRSEIEYAQAHNKGIRYLESASI